MVFDVAPPFLFKRLRKPFFLVYVQYPIEVPTAFPGVFAQPVCQLFLVGWENLQKTLMFYGTIWYNPPLPPQLVS